MQYGIYKKQIIEYMEGIQNAHKIYMIRLYAYIHQNPWIKPWTIHCSQEVTMVFYSGFIAQLELAQ